MKIFTCDQIREIDRYTVENEPVTPADLMERAAGKLYEWIFPRFNRSTRFMIFAGPGNNGGDGLVLARLLWYGGFTVEIWQISIPGRQSEEWVLNRSRIDSIGEIRLNVVSTPDQLPELKYDDVVIDAIFGSGLKRPADGIALNAISHINNSGSTVISVDIPSGLFCEDNTRNNTDGIVKASFTLTFQAPKLSFMFPENYNYVGEFHLIPIGLHPGAIAVTPSNFTYTGQNDIEPILKKRRKFDHKGVFGHCLLVAGSADKAGASVLAAKAALRTGAGLVTCHVPSSVRSVIQSSVPEAMVITDTDSEVISSVGSSDSYNAVGTGPGIGVSDVTSNAVHNLLVSCNKPVVVDADAINILGMNKEWLQYLSADTIITPHLKEFERINGKSLNGYHRLTSQVSFAMKYGCVVVLKGAHTTIALPDGRIFFNSTGNPGMATAGSGDVLTGIILALLGQGYKPSDAAITGVYIHGLAGDIAAETLPYESVMASDIIDNIGNAFRRIRGGAPGV